MKFCWRAGAAWADTCFSISPVAGTYLLLAAPAVERETRSEGGMSRRRATLIGRPNEAFLQIGLLWYKDSRAQDMRVPNSWVKLLHWRSDGRSTYPCQSIDIQDHVSMGIQATPRVREIATMVVSFARAGQRVLHKPIDGDPPARISTMECNHNAHS
jgi:hypothetical protein